MILLDPLFLRRFSRPCRRLRSSARRLSAAAATALALHATAHAADQAHWPTRPIRMVVGFPPGSSPDTLARLVADPLSRTLGQPVVVDNRPGAAGTIGVNAVVRSTDAHTFGITINGPLTTASQLMAGLPYDASRDLVPLSLAATSPLVLVCDPAVPAKTLKGYIDWARVQPAGVTYGSVGQGSGSHLTMALLASKAGLRMVHVPYQGFPQVMNAILGHQVQCSFMAPSGALEQSKAGKVRMLAVSSPARSPLLPEVPTVAEAGGIGPFQADLWIAAFAPATLPPADVKRLSVGIESALQDPKVRQVLLQQGWQVQAGGPEVLAERIADDTRVWGGVIRAANIRGQ